MSGRNAEPRRRRGRSSSVEMVDEKRPKGKKDKKDRKHRDPEPDRATERPRKRARSTSPRQGRNEPALEKGGGDEATLGRTVSVASLGGDVKAKVAWREEMERGEAREEDDDRPVEEGYVAEEDDEAISKKLAESRARREALIAKWVNRGEAGENGVAGGMLETPETAVDDTGDDPSDDEGDNDADKEAANRGWGKDVMSFILKQKAEHDDNMFVEDADEEQLKMARTHSDAIGLTGASADDWDDSEGYYRAKIGEIMGERYLVTEDKCGQGVFSNVVKAKDQKGNDEMVAIKIMRCNDMMRKAAEKEVEVLERLNKTDKQNKKQIVRLMRSFFYRGHLCLVFECMWDNLRMALKKYTKDKGMSLQAVRAYTRQLLTGLRHIHKNNIIHADIKPDNILISAGHNVVKICDLGSAMYYPEEVEPTPYLVSRFYRAPEIVFGARYGPPCDVFALGGTLYELFTGKILFPGRSNNDMLRLFMEIKGKFPHKMIKTGSTWKQHFDENLDFKFCDTNKATRKKVLRVITDMKQKRSIPEMVLNRVGPDKQKSTEADDILYVKKAKQFADLIEKMTAVDPEKRVTAQDALNHPFLVEAGPGSKPKEGDVKGGGKGAKDKGVRR